MIQTFKNHFKAILAGVDDTFPMQLWDKLLPQTILTLNFLCQSNAVPTISAHQYVYGSFGYNKMPLALMGCTVQLHESSERRGTWADKSIDGWYLDISRTLSMLCHICKADKKQESIRHSVFQNKIYHTTNTQPWLTLLSKC